MQKTLKIFASKILVTCLLCLTYCHGLFGFELNRVILSTNNNPDYIEFWPVVAPVWQAMGIRPTLALIADENCPIDTSLGDVVRFDPIPGMPESFQAQTVRLLLPILFPDDVCIISDIDMIPISKSYFVDNAKPCPDDAILLYRDLAWGHSAKRYAMCYSAAKGSVFQSIFSVSTYEEIGPMLQEWMKWRRGWETDEHVLFSKVKAWERNGGKVMRLGHRNPGRLSRVRWFIPKQPDLRKYIDCHCPRPYSAYKDSIDRIITAIYALLESPPAPATPPARRRR